MKSSMDDGPEQAGRTFGSAGFSSSSIVSLLKNQAVYDVRVLDSVDSTNSFARNLAHEGAPEGTVVIAEEQTKGRGRRGHSFHSPAGTGLYMSIVLRPSIAPFQAYLLTCMAAVAVSRAADRVCGCRTSIKWINDVFLGQRKIAGILTEGSSRSDGERFEYAIVGMGVNVSDPAEGWPDDVLNRAGSLGVDSTTCDVRGVLAAAILDEFWRLYEKLPEDTFHEEYRDRCFVLGSPVSVSTDGGILSGVAVDLDDEYRLVVETPEGELRAFSNGERLDAAAFDLVKES